MARVFRLESGRAVAALTRRLGDLELAEDAVQEAFLRALAHWPEHGFPRQPFAWIVTSARNLALDRLRRESLGRALIAEQTLGAAAPDQGVEALEPLDDDTLRLVFTCCHPALAPEARVALTLRLVCGVPTDEIARAFLVEEATVAQRIARAKRKVREAMIPYRIPGPSELPARLDSVLTVVYLVYNASHGGRPVAGSLENLADEGLRLARLLCELMPEEAECAGLLALLLLDDARRAARFDAKGELVRLRDQDRSLWDRARIAEGQEILRACLAHDRPGPYQLQAAIQAVHSDADCAERTDWGQILDLYDHLLEVTPTPVVALNRAIAAAEVHGPALALEQLECLELGSYYLFHATRGDFLERLGRGPEAAAAFRRAAGLATAAAERSYLHARASQAAGPEAREG